MMGAKNVANYTHIAYILVMKLTFVEMTVFEKYRADYLSDDEYREFQEQLLKNPSAGDVIPGLDGLRKVRHKAKGKGQRGGVRVIYYHYDGGDQVWLFMIYAKGEVKDMTPDQKKAFSAALGAELKARS